MFDPERWFAQVTGADCELCRQNADPAGYAEELVCELPSGRVMLQHDGDFPGYCILVHRRHAMEITELSLDERNQLMEDVASVARAVLAVCQPAKLNYAVLGNEAPHLHCHVIPRYQDDGWWGKAIWLRPADQRRALDPGRFAQLRAALSEALGL